MKSCAFFGHINYNYNSYKEFIESIIAKMIEIYGVTQFYAGDRGDFDDVCASIVCKLKEKYPQIKMTRVFSYIPKEEDEYSSQYYDDSVYLLERYVPPKRAIIQTNKALVNKVDYVILGLRFSCGDAATAAKYAYKRKKKIVNILNLDSRAFIWDMIDEEVAAMGEEEKKALEEEKARVWKKIKTAMEERKK